MIDEEYYTGIIYWPNRDTFLTVHKKDRKELELQFEEDAKLLGYIPVGIFDPAPPISDKSKWEKMIEQAKKDFKAKMPGK